jgi:C-terminal processing protease CtpA/Prc
MEALWHIIDEHYCFLDYKQQAYGLDWTLVHNKYKERVKGSLTRKQLFEVLCDMLAELRDGHVNLTAAHDFGRYWTWYEAYPTNFSDTLLRRYMGTDYQIASGIKYKILDDNIGYMRYESFNDGIGEGNLDEVFKHMLLCRGLIIDIRNNSGGMLTNAEKLAARFCHKLTLVGYYQHKTGPGHSDFSSREERYLAPSANLRWNKPAVVLTNRRVFSAANEFAVYMKTLPNVFLVGDHTGGGAGMPFNSSLPNGWSVRFSACPILDKDGRQTEFGMAPDVAVSLSAASTAKDIDDIIEKARQILSQ